MFRLIERSPINERSVSPVEYHDLQTKTLLDLLKNISEEAEDYASSNESSEKIVKKSPMIHLSRQLKKITVEHTSPTNSYPLGPMGNTTRPDSSKVDNSSTSAASNIQVNIIHPSPDHGEKSPTISENLQKDSNSVPIPTLIYSETSCDDLVNAGKCFICHL